MFARLLTATVLAALVVPGVAQAHHTAVPIVALDYSNRILPGTAERAGVRATVEDAGRKLRLTVPAGHEATVLGYEGEPFLRIGGAGVQAAVHSTDRPRSRPRPRGVPGPDPDLDTPRPRAELRLGRCQGVGAVGGAARPLGGRLVGAGRRRRAADDDPG